LINCHGIIEHCSIYSLGVLAFLGYKMATTLFAAFAISCSSGGVASGGPAEALGVYLVHVLAALAVVGEGGQCWSLWVGGRVSEHQLCMY